MKKRLGKKRLYHALTVFKDACQDDMKHMVFDRFICEKDCAFYQGCFEDLSELRRLVRERKPK